LTNDSNLKSNFEFILAKVDISNCIEKILDRLDLLENRISYLEQELFYQKDSAILGSTLSEFCRLFEEIFRINFEKK
jgi:hypothetical protein